MTTRPDVVVVGSGFGGAVMAARLAQRGLRVVVLERGPWWGPGGEDRPPPEHRAYPRGPLGIRKVLRGIRWARGRRPREILLNRDGLLEFHAFPHLLALTSSGVGGGSHVYTNIQAQPEPGYFDAFPPEITAAEMEPYYTAVRQMLRPVPAPQQSPRTVAFARAVDEAALATVEYPDLAVTFGSGTGASGGGVLNAAKVAQRPSTYSGTDILGCEDRSKTTLDLTYLPLALHHGAEVWPLAEVVAIAPSDSGYRLRWRDHLGGGHKVLETPRLVLAAGTLGTCRLLLCARDRDRTLPTLPARLGHGLTPNGDMVTVLYRSARLHDADRGPPFGAFSRVTHQGRQRYLIGDVGLPLEALPLPRKVHARLAQSAVLFAMGRDAGGARAWLEDGCLYTDAARRLDPGLFDEIEASSAAIAAHLDPRRLLFNWPHGRGAESLTTVHPLGGAGIGTGPHDGVVDHRGRVFDHPGLVIADGSLYPSAPGIPPSMTIAALAERQAALFDDTDVATSTSGTMRGNDDR